jgi:two-component system phosphate regulon sensor histidine kinase PhoR
MTPDDRERRRSRSLRWLFAFGLAAWTSLGAWWGIYLYRTTRDLQSARFELLASRLGLPPLTGSAADVARLRSVAPDVVARLEEDFRQKMLMLGGEGALLIGLLLAVHVALYRGLVAERRLHRQRDSFVHAVTHELKSPIAGLRALLQSLRELELSQAERADYLSMGLSELTRLDRMVGNILLSARIDAAGYAPQLTVVDFEAAIAAAVRQRRLLLTERGAHVEIDMHLMFARCDPEGLEVILGNLIDNAIKYSPGAPQLRLWARHSDDMVVLLVEDKGIGIAADEGRHLFEKFYRTAAGEKLAPKGTGLGLYISRGIARACGGDLVLQSGQDGTTFMLTLPLVKKKRS